uniref:Salivary serotonin-binding protein n=1 Tax=Ixodes scapularis TaxID=6945 RepID=Q4PN41_IXOSC|nr:salivary serotonin-binding protein [Ixodes scapularis]
MYPTLLAFASLVAAIVSVGSGETSSSGTPVDAWRTVSLPDAFYLVYRSIKYDPYIGTGICVSIQSTKPNEAAKTTESTIKSMDPKTSEMTEKTVRVKVFSTPGDTIQMSNAEEGGTSATTSVQFVYSDYGTCDVVKVLETDEPQCELWVKQDYQQLPQANTDAVASRADTSVNQKIAKCEEEYNKQCPDQKKYRIYDTAKCSSK